MDIISYKISEEMDSWLSSGTVADVAQSIREASAEVAEATSGIGPTWRPLKGVFYVTGITHKFYEAGNDVSAWGEDVRTAGNNIAQYLEDCAQVIQGLESRRPELIERINDFNYWYVRQIPQRFYFSGAADLPWNITWDMPDDWTPWHPDAWSHSDYANLVGQINGVRVGYVEAIEEMAHKLKSLDDDGTTSSRWLGLVVDVVIVGVAVVGAFIPPVGYIAFAAGAIKSYYDEYQDRQRELLEEHPELSDGDITEQAFKTALVNGTITAFMGLALQVAGGAIAGKLAKGMPLTDTEQKILQAAIEEVGGLATGQLPLPG